jgi:uncharacterized membrane protein YhiD involved in acid resistance
VAEVNGLQRAVGGIGTTVIAALLIAAIGGVLILWRDVGLLQRRQETLNQENTAQYSLNREFTLDSERQKHIIATLERFKRQYDTKESQTDEHFTRHFALIVDVQQRLQSLTDRIMHLEQQVQRLEKQKSP